MTSLFKTLIIFSLLVSSNFIAFSQNQTVIQGTICDADNKIGVSGASVMTASGKIKTQTDKNGYFSFEIPTTDSEIIIIKHPEYQDYSEKADSGKNFFHIHLQPKTIELKSMTITAQSKHTLAETSLSGISANRSFFQKTNANTFAESLSKLPGVASMNVGVGVAKPVIRGMGFNRMAVVDKGIVIQNQQWGADHGLELDQFDVDQLIVYKGSMSLFYGSDAMGGVIEILPAEVPAQDHTWGDVSIFAKSNNGLVGSSVGLNVKSKNWFYRMRSTVQNYGDYRIPADTIDYLTWKMPIVGRRMKNTAGHEIHLSGTALYSKNDFNSAIYISNNYSKNGFFPGAHGIPNLRRLAFDGSHRNVELPYSTVNHFKISNTTEFPIFTLWKVHADFGFQNNQRYEMALFHTHFPNQAVPQKEPNKELAFNLKTISGNVRFHNIDNEKWGKTFGFSTEYQINKIGGYSFLMPEFKRFTNGIFGATNYKVNEKWTMTGGLRFDFGKIDTQGFYDTILEDYFKTSGYDESTAKFYAQRAKALKLYFTNFSGAVGTILRPNPMHQIKMNLGRSFRFPTPNELASNGVHHGAFRHERGSEKLKPETGLQLDTEYSYKHNKWYIGINPFVNYFSNYIFLNPTGQWSLLPHAGQQYEYAQSKALMWGGEIETNYQMAEFLKLSINLEHIFTLNLNSGYALPFSPPTRWTTNMIFSANAGKIVTHYSVNAEIQQIFAQNRITNNEIKTPGATLFNLTASLNWKAGKQLLISELQVYNIFNTAYLNHLSYYRKLNAPEPGRNIQLFLKLPF